MRLVGEWGGGQRVTEKQECRKCQNDRKKGGGGNGRKSNRAIKKSQGEKDRKRGDKREGRGAGVCWQHSRPVHSGSVQNSAGPPRPPCSPSISAHSGSRQQLHLNLLGLDVRTDRSPGPQSK